jgi:hypothetical protein
MLGLLKDLHTGITLVLNILFKHKTIFNTQKTVFMSIKKNIYTGQFGITI